MINKKRQELLINNLKSISAEVRKRSLQQLMQIPTIPDEDKQKFARDALQDSDEEVRVCAAECLRELGVANEPSASDSGLPPLSSFSDQPSSSDTGATSPLPPLQPSSPANPPVSPPPQQPAAPVAPTASPVSSNAPLPPLQPSSQINQPASSSPQQPAVTGSELPVENTLPPIGPDAPISKPLPLNETIDSSLPDLKKINDIPTLLQHVKMLTDKKPAGYLSLLLQLAESVQEEVALAALQGLLNLKDNRTPPQILFMLSNENFSSQRRFLMLKIIMDADSSLDSHLLERILINEKDVIVKSGLVKVFARNSREKGLNTLISCLQDADPRVRANTVEVIEEQKISGCEQQILQLLQDPENRVKVNAAKYLVKNGYQQAFLTLRSMLVSSEVWLRDSVIFALGEIGDQASLTLLKAALKDPNQGIRLSVLKSLAKINNSTARQVLRAASGDPDPVVAQVANSLWEKLKDTPLREDIKMPSAPPQAAVQPVAAPTPPAPPQAPVQPVAAPTPPADGAPVFARPRSAEIYAKLCSENVEDWRSAARDIAFVMGDDQMILVQKAYNHKDENVRLSAAKILSRKRTPEAKAILQQMANDPNEIVRSLVEKTLLITK
jgi:HEAT repeat protein